MATRENLFFAVAEALEARAQDLEGHAALSRKLAAILPRARRSAERYALEAAQVRVALAGLALREPEDFDAAAWMAGAHAALTVEALRERGDELESDLAHTRAALALVAALPAPNASSAREGG